MADGFSFGQKIADDYVPAESGDVQWIRGFKDASTQIRICPAVGTNARGERVTGYKAWPTEREHYDEELQLSYACVREYGQQEPDGVGCNHPSKKVRDRSRRYYVNALDKDGELRIYKFGPAVYNVLKMRQDRMMAEDPSNDQPLSDRDYIINKSGSGMSTKYDVESGDKYPVEGGFPEELHDIPAAINAAHAEAMAKYNGDDPIPTGNDDEDRAVRKSPVATEDEPVTKPAAKKAAAKKTAAPKEVTTTVDELEDLDNKELREWVMANKPANYDPPAAAPRSKLMKIAEAIIEGDNPPF